ncbi:MAG TPA: archaetidylserine decarboxylase [Steroidobacteraceae bacterium]|nr:archaetidylserine decarboxylase [Steroidobacteraceae bacterium]
MSFADRAFAALQYLLPKHALSRAMHALMRTRIPWLKNLLIRGFLLFYDVDRGEMAQPEPLRYETFNAFFTRALRPAARPVAAGPDVLICPVDGTASQSGRITGDRILQAKGRTYSALELLGGDPESARHYADGEFACLYLAPHNYHRIHMPASGRLLRTIYVPGDLFSVNAATARAVPNVFARNERVVCEFDTEAGRLAVVLVGALFVGSIETVWAGELNPPPRRRRTPTVLMDGAGMTLGKGDEIGRFNMGSTVVLLGEPGRLRWRDGLLPGSTVRFGEQLATVLPARQHVSA